MASRRSTWCSLCGVIVSTSQGDPQETSLTWLNDVRVVRTIGPRWDVLLTGVGYLSNRKQVCASADPADHWRRETNANMPHGYDEGSNTGGEAGIALPSYAPHFLYNNSRKYWCFPFHDVCWSLLKGKVLPHVSANGSRNTHDRQSGELHDDEEKELAHHLFTILYNTPIHAYDRLMPGHDYGYAAGLRHITRRQGYYFQVRASQYPYLIDDPYEMLQMDEHCLWKAVAGISLPFRRDEPPLLATRLDTTTDTEGLENYNELDPFAQLPYEVVMIIFTYLPSTDLCKLRLASRGAARISSPRELPQSFWRSRFDPEFEMGFVFAADTPGRASLTQVQQTDWRDLYIKAKANLTEYQLFPGFGNRQRIWLCLQPIVDALKVRLRNKGCTSHVPYAEMMPPLAADEKHANWVCSDAALAPMPSHSLAQFELVSNCRLMEMEKLLWLPSFRRQEGVKVVLKTAFADYCGKTYISGLSLESATSPNCSLDAVLSERAGFVNTTKFEELVLDASWEVRRVEVALCCTGLTGIRLHFQGHDSSRVVKTVGAMSMPGSDVGISELAVPEGTTVTALVVGLDAFKVVSLSLVEKHDGLADRDKPIKSSRERFAPPSEIWTPVRPSTPVSWQFKSARRSQLHDLCLNMEFGGNDGRQLRKLTQVVARMTQFPAVFSGMKFVYEDGTVRCFGAKDGLLDAADVPDLTLEQVFSIDGPGGEVIDRVTVAYSMDHENIRKISIHTNHQRSIDFALQSRSEPDDTQSIRVFEPESGSLLTAFHVKVKMPAVLPGKTSSTGPIYYDLRGCFRNFSIGTVPAHSDSIVSSQLATENDSVDHMIPINRTTLAPVEMRLRHHGGFVFSGADLSCIKRIGVSIGSKGDDMSDDMITGLWLTYHDSGLPVVVGQWKEEVDSLNVAPDDRIVAVQIWHDWNSSDKRLPLGPVVGLLFRLASGEEKKIARRYVVERDCLSFREHRYERMTGILWGCNHKWDHVWVLTTPNPNVPRLLLGQDVADSVQPPILTGIIYEKVFIPGESHQYQGQHNSPNNNPVVSIEVSFWKLDKIPNRIKFFFRYGPPRVLGHPQSEHRPQRIELDVEQGEELTCLHLGIAGHRDTSQIAFITFTTNKGRELDFREQWWSSQGTRGAQWHEKLPLYVFYPFTREAVETSRRAAEALKQAENLAPLADSSESAPAAPTTASTHPSTSASGPTPSRMVDRHGVPISPGHPSASASTSTTVQTAPAATTTAPTTQQRDDTSVAADRTARSPESPSPSLSRVQARAAVDARITTKVKIVDMPPGAGRFVGLWALANHALEYPYLGPMFEEQEAGVTEPSPGAEARSSA